MTALGPREIESYTVKCSRCGGHHFIELTHHRSHLETGEEIMTLLCADCMKRGFDIHINIIFKPLDDGRKGGL